MDGALPAVPGPVSRAMPARPSRPDPISVTRIGTQVVVRVTGDVDDRHADRLTAAVEEVASLALRRVVVDLDDAGEVEGAALDFLATLHGRWTLRLLNAPSGLRRRLPQERIRQ